MSDKPIEKRILKINPDLFSFNSTRKKQNKPTDNAGRIRIKDQNKEQKPRNDTIKKKMLLKMIRQQQEDRYKKMFDPTKTPYNHNKPESTNFNNDFKEAQNFLENLAKKKEENDKNKNYTLKNNYPNQNTNSLLYNNNLQHINIPPTPNTLPYYGCLKNGNLPTYRNFISNNKTVRNNIPVNAHSNEQSQNPLFITQNIKQNGGDSHSSNRTQVMENRINESLQKINELKQTTPKLVTNKTYIKKQKKIKRRTYKIGKSKILPQISVLVSNRSIRNNIQTKSQLLKQVPVPEVKRYLITHGFIRIGSTAPNDVLRKMYESATLICGEVQNHNPDNLLYNFINDKPE